MFARIALFEVGCQLRRPVSYVALALMIGLGLLAISVAGGIGRASGNTVYAASPFALALMFNLLTLPAMFILIATVAEAAMRDFSSGMDVLVRSKPVRRTSYVAAHFVGAFAIVVLIFFGAFAGIVGGGFIPWIAPTLGPLRLDGAAAAFLIFVLPNMLVGAALFFAVAMLARGLVATYLCAAVLVVLYFSTQALLANPAYRTLAALADPFGLVAFGRATGALSLAQRNGALVPLDALLLWNRILWIGIAMLFLAAAVTFSNPRHRAARMVRRKAADAATAIIPARVAASYGGAGLLAQLAACTRLEIRTVLRSWTFLILAGLGVLGCAAALIGVEFATRKQGFPSASTLGDTVAGGIVIVLLIVAVVHSAEMIWRERQTRMASLIDATPTPTFVFIASKLIGLATALVALLAAALLCGIVFQLVHGVREIAFGVYLFKLALIAGLPMLMLGAVSAFGQTLVNKKHLGLIAMIALLIGLAFAPQLGLGRVMELLSGPNIETLLTRPEGFAHKSLIAAWYVGYCAAGVLLMAAFTQLLWVRGVNGSLRMRAVRARQALTPAVALILAVSITTIGATAGYLYWSKPAAALAAISLG
jgi:ABC-type transport system involved in multi-copper enzyme maturation permease subunit